MEYWTATNQLLDWLKEEQNLVEDIETEEYINFKLPLNVRQENIKNISNPLTNVKASRSHNIATMRAKRGRFQSSIGSLTILQKIIQKSINEEIDSIIQKYMKEFFQPAIDNIRRNLPDETIHKNYQLIICQQILIEAMQMYGKEGYESITAPSQPSDYDSDHQSSEEVHGARLSKMLIKRSKPRSSSSESSSPIKADRQQINSSPKSSQNLESQSIIYTGTKDITTETIFVMGSKANKALGLGATRGRLYKKHPYLFRYPVDLQDKQWLIDSKLITPTAGRMFLLLYDEIHALSQSDEYRKTTQHTIGELVGFQIPRWLLDKMKIIRKAADRDGKSQLSTAILRDISDVATQSTASTDLKINKIDPIDPATTDSRQALLGKQFLNINNASPPRVLSDHYKPTTALQLPPGSQVESGGNAPTVSIDDFIGAQEDYVVLNDDNIDSDNLLDVHDLDAI